jgi:hypothetical protein
MRPLIVTLSSALILAGASAPAFAGGVAANHAGFATMHSAARVLPHAKHHYRHLPHHAGLLRHLHHRP